MGRNKLLTARRHKGGNRINYRPDSFKETLRLSQSFLKIPVVQPA